MSASVKVVEGSERVKVMGAVSPALRELMVLVIAMVGGVVSACRIVMTNGVPAAL